MSLKLLMTTGLLPGDMIYNMYGTVFSLVLEPVALSYAPSGNVWLAQTKYPILQYRFEPKQNERSVVALYAGYKILRDGEELKIFAERI